MNAEGTGNREQRAEAESERMKQQLREALPPVGDGGPVRDLWPAMVRRMDAKPAAPPWFDWALAGGVALFAVAFPVAIPVLLYYL